MTFDDLFDRSTITRDQKIGQKYETKYWRQGGINLSGWINQNKGVDGDEKQYRAFYAKPTQFLIDFVNANMIKVNYDAIYVEALFFKDKIRVFARYNQIIGSRIIGDVSLEDWPIVTKETHPEPY